MGLFDFLKGKKESKVVEVYSPLNGKVLDLSQVPDEVFAGKMVGDGCAIDPVEGAVCAPVAGSIEIFDTNHATSFETKSGLEMIVHFGIDTVKLDGKGFERVAESESKVEVGAEIVKYDLGFMKENAKSVITPVVISNMDDVEKIEVVGSGDVKVGDLLMKVTLK